MTSDPYCDWCDAAQAGTYTPLSEARLRDAWEWSRRHGTDCDFRGGEPSVGALFIRELLRERLRLLDAINAMIAEDEARRDEEFGPQVEAAK